MPTLVEPLHLLGTRVSRCLPPPPLHALAFAMGTYCRLGAGARQTIARKVARTHARTHPRTHACERTLDHTIRCKWQIQNAIKKKRRRANKSWFMQLDHA